PVSLHDPNGKEPAASSYQDRAVDFITSVDPSGRVNFQLSVELQGASGERLIYQASGGATQAASLAQDLIQHSGVAQALTPLESETIFSALEELNQHANAALQQNPPSGERTFRPPPAAPATPKAPASTRTAAEAAPQV